MRQQKAIFTAKLTANASRIRLSCNIPGRPCLALVVGLDRAVSSARSTAPALPPIAESRSAWRAAAAEGITRYLHFLSGAFITERTVYY